MGNVAQAHIGSTKQIGQLIFGTMAIANADGTLHPPFFTNNQHYPAPYAGSIIGFAGTLTAVLTTGTLNFHPTINGSLCPVLPDAASVRTNQVRSHYSQPGRVANYEFAAGDALGVMYNKSGTINPTTLDVLGVLVVLYEGVEY